MKIAVVFLLVAVTASYGLVHQSRSGHHKSKHGYGTMPDTNCLQKILKADLQKVLFSIQALFCSYEHCKTETAQCSEDEWMELFCDTKELLKDLGCSVDQLLLGGNPTVEEITEKVGEALKCLHIPIRQLLVELNIEQPVFKVLCKLLGNTLEQVAGLLNNLDDVISIAAPVNDLVSGALGGALGGVVGGLLGL